MARIPESHLCTPWPNQGVHISMRPSYLCLSQPTFMSETTPLTPEDQSELRGFRRRLVYLALISSGIDTVLFGLEIPLLGITFGSSLLVDEIVEYFISSLLAKNKMRLKKRYKIAGFIPIPGLTSLTLQCILEYVNSRRKPEEVLARLREPANPLQV